MLKATLNKNVYQRKSQQYIFLYVGMDVKVTATNFQKHLVQKFLNEKYIPKHNGPLNFYHFAYISRK